MQSLSDAMTVNRSSDDREQMPPARPESPAQEVNAFVIQENLIVVESSASAADFSNPGPRSHIVIEYRCPSIQQQQSAQNIIQVLAYTIMRTIGQCDNNRGQ